MTGYRGRVQTGGTAMIGRIARFVLLACTLFGLAAMHTIGHGTMSSAHHHEAPSVAMHQLSAMPAFTQADPDGCAAGGCLHAAVLPDSGGPMDLRDLCVAVLSAFAVAMLLAGLLLAAVTGRFPPGSGDGRRPALRFPPIPPWGLTVVTVSVLRT
jgi:hypothetical protein